MKIGLGEAHGLPVTDRELEILFEVDKPFGDRHHVVPGPGQSLVYDRSYKSLSERGFIRWRQTNPLYASMSNDHYVTTSLGKKVIEDYWKKVKRIGRSAIDRYTVERVRLNQGGYDRRGRYFGTGERLFVVTDEETGKTMHVRASDAASARASALRSPGTWGGWH